MRSTARKQTVLPLWPRSSARISSSPPSIRVCDRVCHVSDAAGCAGRSCCVAASTRDQARWRNSVNKLLQTTLWSPSAGSLPAYPGAAPPTPQVGQYHRLYRREHTGNGWASVHISKCLLRWRTRTEGPGQHPHTITCGQRYEADYQAAPEALVRH